MNFQLHDIVQFADKYDRNGTPVRWSEGEVTRIYHSAAFTYYSVMDYHGQVHSHLEPKDVQPVDGMDYDFLHAQLSSK